MKFLREKKHALREENRVEKKPTFKNKSGLKTGKSGQKPIFL
jgi:hypothetical protein